MKRFTLLILLIFAITLQSNAQEKDCHSWNPEWKLTWSDFKAKPDRSQASWANTACAIGYSFEGDRDSAHFVVECCFEPEQSWVKENPTDNLLRHEQAHFDIAEIYAREFRKKLSQTTLKGSEATRHIPLIYKAILKEYNDEQRLYDKETDHSRNEIEQKRWEKKVAKRLKELGQFESTKINRSWNK